MRPRGMALAVALVAVVALSATGTQSFSAGELQRGVVVNVAADENAYLGLTRDVADGTTLWVNVTNNVPGDQLLSVTATLTGNGTTTTKTESSLEPGETAQFRFDGASCDGTVHLVAVGPSVGIELSRPVPCDGATTFVVSGTQTAETTATTATATTATTTTAETTTETATTTTAETTTETATTTTAETTTETATATTTTAETNTSVTSIDSPAVLVGR